jgi:hypothetical protein
MKVIIVEEVFSDRVVDPNRYRSLLQESTEFFTDCFDLQTVPTLSEADKIMETQPIRGVIFLSQAMIKKAIDLGNKHPRLTILVFSSILDSASRRVNENVFLVKKNGRHLQEALRILDPF